MHRGRPPSTPAQILCTHQAIAVAEAQAKRLQLEDGVDCVVRAEMLLNSVDVQFRSAFRYDRVRRAAVCSLPDANGHGSPVQGAGMLCFEHSCSVPLALCEIPRLNCMHWWAGPHTCTSPECMCIGPRTFNTADTSTQVLKSQSSDGESVMAVLSRQTKDKHVYAKQMGKFISCIQRRWLKQGVHIVSPTPTSCSVARSLGSCKHHSSLCGASKTRKTDIATS